MPLKPVCRVTHPQINSGVCPWCHLPVIENEFGSVAPEERSWNVPRMIADLEGENLDAKSVSISNLMFHGPGIEIALPVLAKAINDPSPRISRLACDALTKLGRELSPEEVERYQEFSTANSADTSLHILLLGSYFSKQFHSAAVRKNRQLHILSLIRDSPTLPVCGTPFTGLDSTLENEPYQEVKRLWMKHIEEQPRNVAILGNAATFFTIHDRVLSGELLRRAKALEPENSEWSKRLGHLYSLESISCPPEAKGDWAAMTLAELESAAGRTTDQRARRKLLVDLANAAFEAGDFDKARTFAEELISTAGAADEFLRDLDAIHHGHTILGRLAALADDGEAAKAHLIASVGPKGSPVMSSFGPKMTLAKDLLERGEKEAVLQYLRMCSAFWTLGASRLSDWSSKIELGEMPDFGRHHGH